MTEIHLFSCILLCILLPSGLEAQERWFQGRLQRIGEYDEWLDEVGVDVAIVEANSANRTAEGGIFRIFLKDEFQAGQQVTLGVKKDGWKILSPPEGKIRIPTDLDLETVTVRLLPVDSKLFWTHNRLKKFIEDLAEDSKKQVTPDGKPEDIDFSLAIRDWAEKYGFSAQEARAEIDKWVVQVEENFDDLYEVGLAAYVNKNFDKAIEHFEGYTDHKIKQLEEIERKESELREKEEQTKAEIIRGFRAAGNTHYSNYQFEKALAQYQHALDYVSQAETPKLWGAILNGIGMANSEIGIRIKGDAVQHHLNAAIEAYGRSLEVYTRDQLPQDWAMIQNNLGNVLSEQGIRTDEGKGTQLLSKAVEAYQNALEVRIRDQLPQDWAATQNNLGNVLINQGIRTGGAEGTDLLAQAVEAYQNALEVRIPDQLPQQWAMTQSNLGNVLSNQGIRTGGAEGTDLLAQAVEAYQKALEVYTRDQLPQQWATIQNNLGNALRAQGIRTDEGKGTQLLSKAVEAYQNALEVRIRDQLPQDWATTQNNLGNVLINQGIRTGGAEGTDLLSQAVEAYQKALEVYTRDQLPQQWAMTQSNLGNVLSNQGIRTCGEKGTQLLSKAVAAYQNALEVQTYEHLPVDWARTQNNLAKTYVELQDWRNAVMCYANVLKVYPDYQPDVDPRVRIAIRTIEIANLLALDKAEVAPSRLDALIEAIASHPEDFKVGWSFEGTKYFISQTEKLEPYREWLLGLFKAVESESRDAILSALREVQADFHGGAVEDR